MLMSDGATAGLLNMIFLIQNICFHSPELLASYYSLNLAWFWNAWCFARLVINVKAIINNSV